MSGTHAQARRSARRATWPLFLVVFVSGMTTMALEMSASRLLGPYFGDSILVWANLIGLVLIYLTVGAYLGGRWADRRPNVETMYTITTIAAFMVGLVPLIAVPILDLAQNAFARVVVQMATFDAIQIGGSFIAVLVLLGPPTILMGCVSPFAVRLATKQIRSAGSSAGRVYAVSTLGSILGTFAPVLLVIPAIGTAKTFLLFGFLLLAASLTGLLVHQRQRHAMLSSFLLILLVTLSVLFPQRVVKADERAIYEQESRYNYIQVLEMGQTRYLMLNEGQGVHSVYDPDSLATFGTWDMFVIAPFFNNPPYSPSQVERMCIIGLAGGTVARQVTEAYGPIPIDGVEIDPAIVDVGRRFFAMNQSNLNVFTTDGRFFLSHTEHAYDLIVVDAYRLPYIPFQLATTEFFALAKERLTPDGVLTVNVGRTDSDYRLVEAIAATLRPHFASIYAIDLPDTFNTVMVATQEETQATNLTANLELVQHPFLRDALVRAAANLEASRARHPLSAEGVAFTDDRAPVEAMTNALLLRYLLFGE